MDLFCIYLIKILSNKQSPTPPASRGFTMIPSRIYCFGDEAHEKVFRNGRNERNVRDAKAREFIVRIGVNPMIDHTSYLRNGL